MSVKRVTGRRWPPRAGNGVADYLCAISLCSAGSNAENTPGVSAWIESGVGMMDLARRLGNSA
jgi:hypothetical protein